MTGPELTFLENGGAGRSSNDKHLSVILANGRPVFTADVPLAVALTAAVLESA